jgi:L-threonylcarbamoyladenylate synthase
VHIAALEELGRVAALPSTLPARWVEKLASACWPGPLSLILPRAPAIPDQVTAGRPTVAVRMPAHPVALALIRAAGLPIAAPSANLFMHTSPTTARHVLDDLNGRIGLILDSGPTPLGVESTVLDLTGVAPRVLRPGGVSLERLRAILGVPVLVGIHDEQSAGSGAEQGLPAPGLLTRHYAPHAEFLLLDGSPLQVRLALAQRARALLAAGTHAGALLPDEDAQSLAMACPGIVLARLGPERDLPAIASRLYTGMRELEAAGVETILARNIGGEGLARAIGDRLLRAAGGRLICIDDTCSAPDWPIE